jgi:hypothetical protein
VVPVSRWRIAAAVSSWLLAVTVVSCLAWLAIASAGQRVGLATTAVGAVSGRPADGPGDADGEQPAAMDRALAAADAVAEQDGEPPASVAPVAPTPVTGRSGTPANAPTGEPEPTGTNGTGPDEAEDSTASTDTTQRGGAFRGAPAPARTGWAAEGGEPGVAQTGPPPEVLPTVTSGPGGAPPATSTDTATSASGDASPAGRVSATFAVSGGQLVLTCSSSTVVDWRVLASIGWAATGGLQSPAELLATFTRSARQTVVLGECATGAPVFSVSAAAAAAASGAGTGTGTGAGAEQATASTLSSTSTSTSTSSPTSSPTPSSAP